MSKRSSTLPAARIASWPVTARDRLGGLGALVVLAALVVGVPVLLYQLFGSPIPHKVPDPNLLMGQLSQSDVLHVIVFVLWLVWLHFLVCTVIEAVYEIRGRGVSPHVPLGGASQSLSRRLIASILLIAGTAGVTVPAAAAVAAPNAGEHTSSVVATQTTSQPDTGRVSTRTLVSSERTSSVVPRHATTTTSHQAIGLTSHSTATTAKYYEVKPHHGRHYDTLWDIAERYLQDGRRYKEIYQLNHDHLQPDGGRLKNPDLIYPGWQLQLPSDAEGPGVRTINVSTTTPPVTTPAHHQTARPTTPSQTQLHTQSHQQVPQTQQKTEQQPTQQPSQQQTVIPPGQRQIGQENTSGVQLGQSSEQQTTPSASAPAPNPQAKIDLVADSHEENGTNWGLVGGAFGAGAALLAGGLVLALRRRRRWTPGPGPVAKRHHVGSRTEINLRMAADVASSQFVDSSLRQLGALLSTIGQPAPPVVAALLDGTALTLVLAPGQTHPTPPAPWQATSGGSRWVLRRAYGPRTEIDAPAPYPTLVTVGRNADGALVLIDIDYAAGPVSFGGHVDPARDMVASLSVELATNPWSDSARVTMVGFGGELAELAPRRLRYTTSLDETISDVRRVTDDQVRACQTRRVDTVADGRLLSPEPGLWTAQVIVSSGVPTDEQTHQLAELCADPRRSVAVLVVGDVMEAPWRFVIDTKHEAICRMLGLEVAAHTITTDQFAELVDLFRAADTDARDTADVPHLDEYHSDVSMDLSQAAPVEVDLLGPVEIDARGPVDAGRKELASEIVAFLAAHDFGVHPNVLTGAVWPRGVSEQLRDAAIEHTSRWLGPDCLVTDAEGRIGLNRQRVRVDWDVFRTLLKQADEGNDPRASLKMALDLVHGAAWSNLPAGRYAWLAGTDVERQMSRAVISASLRLADLALDRGDGAMARRALQTGLRFAPASEELWRKTLQLAAHFGSTRDVSGVADQMYASLNRYGSPRGPESETDALVDELLPNYRRTAA